MQKLAKYLEAFIHGIVLGVISLLILIAIAEGTDQIVYTTDIFPVYFELATVLMVAVIASESKMDTSAKELILDGIVILMTVYFFLQHVGSSWWTRNTGVLQILKDFAVPLGIDVFFATVLSSPINKKFNG